jgi:hypothetical protein
MWCYATSTVDFRSFGVTWDVSAGVTAPAVAIVTAGATFDRKMADVQTVKLTYGPEMTKAAYPPAKTP